MYGRSATSGAQTPLTQLTGYTSVVNQTVIDFSMDSQNWHRLFVVTNSRNVWFGNIADDLSQSWTNFTGNLGSFGLNRSDAIAFVPIAGDPNNGALIVGTGRGVFYSLLSDATHSWQSFSGNIFPNVLVFDLDYDYNDDVLLAATMGRGMYTLSAASLFFASIPEPATVSLVGISMIGGFIIWRRRRYQFTQAMEANVNGTRA